MVAELYLAGVWCYVIRLERETDFSCKIALFPLPRGIDKFDLLTGSVRLEVKFGMIIRETCFGPFCTFFSGKDS